MSLSIRGFDPQRHVDLYVHIYSFSDKNTKKVLQHTSKQFHTLFKVRYPLFKKIEKFIRANYVIIGGYPTRLDCTHFFYAPFILGLGECHINPAHAFANGTLINLLWMNVVGPSLLLTEGGSKALDQANPMLAYVAPSIVSTTQSWDLEISEMQAYNKCFHNAKIFIRLTQRCLELFSQSSEGDIAHYCHYLAVSFGKDVTACIWKGIASDFDPSKVSLFKSVEAFIRSEWQNDPASCPKIRCVFKYWLLFYLRHCLQNRPQLAQQLKDVDLARDRRMQHLATQSLGKYKNKIFVSGEDHLVQLDKYFACQPVKTRYLCITPREDLTHTEVLTSLLFYIFGKSIPSSYSVLAQSKPIKEDTHEERIAQLLGFDYKKLSWHGENYVTVWEDLTLLIIEEEEIRLKAALALL